MTSPKPDDDRLLEENDQEPEALVIEAAETPVPFMRGKFALYETPGGGIHLSYETEQHGTGHRDFPGRLVRMMSSGRMGRMFGGISGE